MIRPSMDAAASKESLSAFTWYVWRLPGLDSTPILALASVDRVQSASRVASGVVSQGGILR